MEEDIDEGPAVQLPKVPDELLKFIQSMEGEEGNNAKQFFEDLEKVQGLPPKTKTKKAKPKASAQQPAAPPRRAE
eukprot:1452655-Pyramimonas_sp.AAC.1